MNNLTVDELIAKLEEIKSKSGNLDVFFRFSKDSKEVSNVEVEADEWSDSNLCVIS